MPNTHLINGATDRRRWRIGLLVVLHLLLSGAVAAAFAWQFGQGWRAVATHVVVLAEWDALILVALTAVVAFRPEARIAWACRLLPAATLSCQVYLYALNAVSNSYWGRNITGHLVTAFAPTIWSGKEPFPVGTVGITVFVLGTMAVMAAASRWWGPALEQPSRFAT